MYRVTAHDVMDVTSSIETNTKFDFSMARLAAPSLMYMYKCVPYSSHSDSSSRISA